MHAYITCANFFNDYILDWFLQKCRLCSTRRSRISYKWILHNFTPVHIRKAFLKLQTMYDQALAASTIRTLIFGYKYTVEPTLVIMKKDNVSYGKTHPDLHLHHRGCDRITKIEKVQGNMEAWRGEKFVKRMLRRSLVHISSRMVFVRPHSCIAHEWSYRARKHWWLAL